MAVFVLGIATILASRRYALVPLMILACAVSPAQRIVILSLDFNFFRLLLLFGWARVIMFGETGGFRWRTLDTVVLLWALSGLCISSLREGTAENLVYRLGFAFDACGMYYLARFLVRDLEDVHVLARALVVISVPVAATFLLEHMTGRNMFSVFGGVSEWTEVREGRVRCRGPFAHPIYAGGFWAAWLPLACALRWGGRTERWLAPVGAATIALIIYTTASSTPILALVAAIGAFALFPLRNFTRHLRWGAAATLVGLHLVMNAPVWHLISRVDVIAGSTGWYRYRLIDGFIRRFDLWWLWGTRAHADIWGPRFKAITNHYILEGVEGGLLTFLLFVAVIALAFRNAGRLVRATEGDRFRQIMAWAIGASFFSHAVGFLAVSYFGQVLLAWYLGVAILGSLAPDRRETAKYRLRRVDDSSPSHPGAPDASAASVYYT